MTPISQNNYVQIYLNNCKLLIRTMIVKSSFAASAINKELQSLLGSEAVNEHDPTTWKYYMNLAGEYHSTDKPMFVISLDTKERILFSPENLLIHKLTADSYVHGSRYYLALVNQYPDQEFLINCILTPCNKETAIDAEDGVILSYQKNLVEDTETTLIQELEIFAKNFISRWHVEAFALTDAYYPYMQRFILGQQLFLKLLNLRLKRCKTDEAHSFHITQYLASHNRLDRWSTYLTRKQLMWFYRNISYIQRNPGKVEVFRDLIKNIFEEAEIPVSEFSIQQLNTVDQEGYPNIRVLRNEVTNLGVVDSSLDFSTYNSRTLNSTYGNSNWYAIHGQKEIKKLKSSRFSKLKTKNLETTKSSGKVNLPDPLEEVAVRNWISLTYFKDFDQEITFLDPRTAVEYTLSSWDAVIYAHYLALRAEGATFTRLPPISVPHFRLKKLPPLVKLLKKLPYGERRLQQILTEFYNTVPRIGTINSVAELNKLVREISYQQQKQWMILADEDDLYGRGYLEASFMRFFGSRVFDFSLGEDIEVWRARLNLPVFNMSWREAAGVIASILEAAIGLEYATKTTSVDKESLIKLFRELSSYAVQFISDVSDNDSIILNSNGLRTSIVGFGVPILGSPNDPDDPEDPENPKPKPTALNILLEIPLEILRNTFGGSDGGPSVSYEFVNQGSVSVIRSPLDMEPGIMLGDDYIYVDSPEVNILNQKSGDETIFLPLNEGNFLNIIE